MLEIVCWQKAMELIVNLWERSMIRKLGNGNLVLGMPMTP
jgi:hypothetical protein